MVCRVRDGWAGGFVSPFTSSLTFFNFSPWPDEVVLKGWPSGGAQGIPPEACF